MYQILFRGCIGHMLFSGFVDLMIIQLVAFAFSHYRLEISLKNYIQHELKTFLDTVFFNILHIGKYVTTQKIVLHYQQCHPEAVFRLILFQR